MGELSPEALEKLTTALNIWVGSVKPDGNPHLTPVWFVYHEGDLYISIDPKSVKSRNIRLNPHVALALEDGLHPVICEGRAALLEQPWPADVLDVYLQKYEWDLTSEEQYNQLVRITPDKWLAW